MDILVPSVRVLLVMDYNQITPMFAQIMVHVRHQMLVLAYMVTLEINVKILHVMAYNQIAQMFAHDMVHVLHQIHVLLVHLAGLGHNVRIQLVLG
jgi:hypothetical protein